MKALVKALILSAIVSATTSCQAKYFKHGVGVDVKIKQVKVNNQTVENPNIKDNYFGDNNLEIYLSSHIYGAHFVLKNNSNDIMKIIWDETALISETGETHRVYHSGIKYSEVHNSHPPSLIAPGGKLSDVIYPSDYLDVYTTTAYKRPFVTFIEPRSVTESDAKKLKKTLQATIKPGKEFFDLLMTVQTASGKTQYYFDMVVDKAVVKELPESEWSCCYY